MYLLYLLLQICNAVHKCSNCKYYIRDKFQVQPNNVVQYIPEKCKLYTYLHVDKQDNIIQDYLDTTICRKYKNYCGKDGKYFEN
jgi:hypothetical protein